MTGLKRARGLRIQNKPTRKIYRHKERIEPICPGAFQDRQALAKELEIDIKGIDLFDGKLYFCLYFSEGGQ